MTDLVLIAAIAAVPPTLAALGACFVSLKNGRKADEIHVLVNSNLAAVKKELMDTQHELAAMRDVVTALVHPTRADV